MAGIVTGSVGAVPSATAADAVVVCPENFRAALKPWLDHREAQGLSVQVIPSQRNASTLLEKIREVATESTTYVVLVGDAPVIGAPCNSLRQVPIHYKPTKVTSAWGAPPTLATDLSYGDFNNDGKPNAVVGRLPVDDADQLSQLVRRIVAHEESVDFGAWRGNVQLTGGVGGFGMVADAAIESVTRSVLTNVLPTETRSCVAYASPGHRFFPKNDSFTNAVLERYKLGSRFWVYAGHGNVTALDRVPQNASGQPVLDQRTVQQLAHPHGGSPIALMLACYTGALDASEDSIAEEMLLCDGGPIAVFAGSRVTMPYGNATAAVGLINGVFEQKLPRLGDAWLCTLNQMHQEQTEDQSTSRVMIDALAAIVSPPGTSLVGERREHMQLYNLIGDPTLRLHHPQEVAMTVPPGHDAGQPISLDLNSPISGQLVVSIDRPLGAVVDGDPNETTVTTLQRTVVADTPATMAIQLPDEVKGPVIVRAFVSGEKTWATAAARTIVRQKVR